MLDMQILYCLIGLVSLASSDLDFFYDVEDKTIMSAFVQVNCK